MNKHENIRLWLADYLPLGEWMYFNTISDLNGQIGIATLDGETAIQEFICGDKVMSYRFSVIMIKGYDEGTSNINTDAMNECENFIKWVEEQNKIRNYPDMGGDVQEIEVLQGTPNLALINQDEQTAKYTFAVAINYIKKGVS